MPIRLEILRKEKAISVGNSGGIIVQILFGIFIFHSTKRKGIRLIAFFVIGYILYEIVQPFLPKGVFDWKDIYGTIIGGVLGLLIPWLIHFLDKEMVFIFALVVLIRHRT